MVVADIGVGGQRGLIYDSHGIAPTLSATQYKDSTKVLVYERNNETRSNG